MTSMFESAVRELVREKVVALGAEAALTCLRVPAVNESVGDVGRKLVEVPLAAAEAEGTAAAGDEENVAKLEIRLHILMRCLRLCCPRSWLCVIDQQ